MSSSLQRPRRRTSQALDEIDALGVLELPEESWCLLQLQLRGELPSVGCSCADYEQLQMSHVSHSVPNQHVRMSELGEFVRSAVDEITRTDAQAPPPPPPPPGSLTTSGAPLRTTARRCCPSDPHGTSLLVRAGVQCWRRPFPFPATRSVEDHR